MVEENKVCRLELCGDIKDGTWTSWETVETEKCFGMRNNGRSTCGPGQNLQRRICSRTLGGKYCKDQETQTGVLVDSDVMVRTVPCQDVDCPGKIVHVTKLNYQIKCSEWENPYQVPLERVTIYGPRILISGETIELICESRSSPSNPGLK